MNICSAHSALCGTFAGEGPYAVAKQHFLAEEYEKIIPACQQEIDAQLPNGLRAQARSRAQPPNRFLPVYKQCSSSDQTRFYGPSPTTVYFSLKKFLDV